MAVLALNPENAGRSRKTTRLRFTPAPPARDNGPARESVRRWRITIRGARSMLLDNAKGNYKFIRGYGAPFSSGALAHPGFEIVHATFKPLARLADGYGPIERHMRDASRPINAVCGIELRIAAA